jgi:1,4-alpha-glucan branching enzyme
LYRDLIHLRRNWFNNTRGLRGQHINVFHVNDKDKVIAYHRWENGGAGDDVVVVANFSNNTYSNYGYKISFPRPGRWKVRFNSDWNGYDPTFHNTETMETDAHAEVYDDNMPCCGNISIGPYSAIILSQD